MVIFIKANLGTIIMLPKERITRGDSRHHVSNVSKAKILYEATSMLKCKPVYSFSHSSDIDKLER